MIRQMVAATGQSAQILRAMPRRQFNATLGSLTDDRSDVVIGMAQPSLEYHLAEHQRLQQDRLDIMRQQVHQGMGSDSDLVARMACMRIPPSISSEACPVVPPSSWDDAPPLLRPHDPSQRDNLVTEALHSLTDEELNQQMIGR